MQIFIIADKSLSARQLHSRSHVAERIPDTITLGIKELTNYLAAIDPQSYPPKGSIKTTPAREQQACDSTPKNRG
jgi:hypothetical protein